MDAASSPFAEFSPDHAPLGPDPGMKPLGLEHALKVFRRRWKLILACTVITPVAAFALSRAETKQYTATASLLFNNASVAQEASGVAPANTNDPTGQRNTNLALVQLAGNNVPTRAADALNAGLTPQQVKNAVSASLAGQSNIVSIAATSTKPQLAADIANAYAKAFITEQNLSDQAVVQQAINLVNGQYASLTKSEKATPQGQSLLDHLESLKILKAMQNNTQLAKLATAPSAPSSPKVTRNTILGLFFGLLLGVGLAFLRERLDRRMREPDDVEEATGLPMLSLIPHSASGEWSKLSHEAAEPFRMLRAHLRYFNVDREIKTLLVTSASPAEGKTSISYGLAATAASVGSKTLLIEADLRKPTVSKVSDLPPSIGLAGALVGAGKVEDAIQHVDVDGSANGNAPGRKLHVLAAGAIPPNPSELLESHAMEHLLTWAREHYELVVVDTPPLSVVADAIPLMKSVDGVIIVARLGLSTRDGAERLSNRLASLRAPALGVVVNDARVRRGGYYGYGYGYGYGPGSAESGGSSGPVPVTTTAQAPAGDAVTDGAVVIEGASATAVAEPADR
jgi:receptor protein-tyrosine kinase